MKIMKHTTLTLFALAILLTNCKTTETTTAVVEDKVEPTISYADQLKPIMERSCTPCHFPEKGRKEMLDTYEATSANIKDIIARIEAPVDDVKYMPFKSKRPALSADEIKLFKTWMKQGMGK